MVSVVLVWQPKRAMSYQKCISLLIQVVKRMNTRSVTQDNSIPVLDDKDTIATLILRYLIIHRQW